MPPSPQVRATLEGLMSGAQVQVDSMKVEMDKAVTAQQKAVAEAEEVRSLWEAEVRGWGRGTQGVARVWSPHYSLFPGED